MWTVLMGGCHQASFRSQTVPAGHQASSCSMLPCRGTRGSVRVDFISLAARGYYMNSKNVNKPQPNPKGTPEVALPSTSSGSAPSGLVPQSEMGASGTQEAPLHSYAEAINIEKASMHLNIDDVSSITSAPLEEEDELLRSPERPESAGMLEDAIEKLSSFRDTQ
ncbi:hypothetical protein LSTR_LSTR009049 [Laodelphax striatellus]|uniref:Uncharacterized protein n=1 Tax=Laodelphax striatellus TaxID=195883 RepID=A0A482WJC3_LAOST|nr:hypothetical protein LSTR_LSTR009049 [Laodelphax striatellus]